MTLEDKIEYIIAFGYSNNEILVKHSLLRVEELILNYTNLNQLPKGLDYTHIDMAIVHLKGVEVDLNKPIDGSKPSGVVGSIQEGDTTVKMATARDMETEYDRQNAKKIFEDGLINDFRVPLHKFRKMRW